MDIDKVINIIRESKKASKCPPGYKLDKKTKACVPTKRGKTIVLGYFGRGHDHDHDDEGKKKNGKNGNGSNGNGGNGGSSGPSNGGNSGGNGSNGGNGGGE